MVWLRCYPKQVVLAYLFGVSVPSVLRVINRVLPLLEQRGRDTMRLPDPGRKRRRPLDALKPLPKPRPVGTRTIGVTTPLAVWPSVAWLIVA